MDAECHYGIWEQPSDFSSSLVQRLLIDLDLQVLNAARLYGTLGTVLGSGIPA
jgi:hypothetical protein